MFYEPRYKKSIDKKYRKLKVHKQPITEKIQNLDYKDLLNKYFKLKGKELKPVKTRKGNSSVPASHQYIYDNNGGILLDYHKHLTLTFHHIYKNNIFPY